MAKEGGQEPQRGRDLGDNVKLVAIGAALVLLLLFFALNFDTVEINLLVFKPNLPVAAALLLTALLGFVVGLLVARLGSGRR